MKNTFKTAVLAILSVTAVFSVIMSVNTAKKLDTPAISTLSATESSVVIEKISQPSYNYVAKIWNDSLAIFATSNMAEPWYISNISLYSLTNEDYNKLKDGIYLETSEDISRLLEDFES